jgi:glc operon protein GlcG
MGGGIPLVVDGQCLGAIGISGMTPDQDIAIAEAGVQAFLTLLP